MKRSFLLLLVIGVLGACGSAPASSDGIPTSPPGTQSQSSSTQPTAAGSTAGTAPTQPSGGDSQGAGRATLTLGGETFEFPEFTCLVGHDEASTLGAAYEDNSFVGYTGLVDGVQMRIWIYDMAGQGRLEPPAGGPSIQSGWWAEVQADSLNDLSWAWIATNQLTPGNLSLELDGDRITGSGTFEYWGDGEGEPSPGTVEAECG